MSKPFPMPALKAARVGLESNLAELETIQSAVTSEVRRLAARRDLSQSGLTDRYGKIASDASGKAEALVTESLRNADATLGNEVNWTIDNLLRLAPRESIERLASIEELKLVDPQTFLTIVDDARATNDLPLLYEAGLALSGRTDSAEVRERLRATVNAAKLSLRMPDRDEAGKIFHEVRALRHRIASVWELLQSSKVDLATWVAGQQELSEREEVRSRLQLSGM